MLQQFKYFYRPTSQIRMFPLWTQYTHSLQPQQETLERRFQSLEVLPETPGSKLLSFILREADIPRLAAIADDFYIYSTQLQDIVDRHKNIFDLARSGKAYKGLFIHSHSTPTWEYVIPVDDNDWLKFFPMLQPYSAWEKLKPLQLWWHNSAEYTMDMMSGSLRFHQNYPSMVLWLLDIPTLVMKAVKWYRMKQVQGVTYPDLREYIHTGVLNSIPDDCNHLWLYKLHQLTVDIMLDVTSPTVIDSMRTRSQTQWGSIGARFTEVMEALEKYYFPVTTGEFRPQVLFNQKFYRDGTKSFADIANEIPVYQDIQHQTPFQYLRLLRDLPYLEYLFRVYLLSKAKNKDAHDLRNLMTRLYTLVVKWNNNIPLSNIKNLEHRAIIKSTLESFMMVAQEYQHGD